MPNITTLFEGTDGVSRTLFNQKLSDINAHGNDATMHVTAAEKSVWNGKANGNNAVWVANTTVADPSFPNDLWNLTIPNFVFTEGCQVTFIPPTKASGTKYNAVVIGNKSYALRTPNKGAIEVDSWEAGASVTVTLSVTKVPINGDNARDGTAFFKSGSGSIKEMYDFPLSIQTTEPTPVNTNHIWIQNDAKRSFVIDEAIRVGDWPGQDFYYGILDSTDNTYSTTQSLKTLTDSAKTAMLSRHIARDSTPWAVSSGFQFALKGGIGYYNEFRAKWPRIMSRVGSTIDMENAKRWDGSAWQWLSQKGHYLFNETSVFNRTESGLSNPRVYNSTTDGGQPAVSPDGIYVAITSSNTVRIYKRDGDSFALNSTYVTGGTAGINRYRGVLSFSPDSQYLAFAGLNNSSTDTERPMVVLKKQSNGTWAFLTSFVAGSGSNYCAMWNETGDKLACWGIDGSKYSIFVYSRSVDTFTFYKKLIVTISSSFYTNGLFWGDYIVTIRTATDGSKSWSLNTVSTGEYTAYSSLGNSLVTTFPNIAYVSDGHFIISNREYLSLFAFGSTTAKFNIATGALNNIIYGIAVSSDGKYVFAHISSSIIEVYSISLTSGFALVNTFTTTDSAYSHLACW